MYKRPGPQLFIGELGIGGEYPKNLLAEGVVKLSLERNGDLNPLMADRPLMRNFDFLEGSKIYPLLLHNTSISVKTFNYYLCKMFRDNIIDHYYETQITNQNNVYATAGSNSKTNEFILKIISLSDEEKDIRIDISNIKINQDAFVTFLTANRHQENTPYSPYNVVPEIKKEKISFPMILKIQPNSFSIYRIKLKD
jgi:hypothetical protein